MGRLSKVQLSRCRRSQVLAFPRGLVGKRRAHVCLPYAFPILALVWKMPTTISEPTQRNQFTSGMYT